MVQVILLLQNMSSYLPPIDSYSDIWEAFSSQPNVHSVVATEGGQVVGYGVVVIETKIRGGKLGHIEDIVSHPSRRSQGIGRIIIDALYEIARTHECYKVALQCQQHNIPFYEKCGYKVSGVAMQRFAEQR